MIIFREQKLNLGNYEGVGGSACRSLGMTLCIQASLINKSTFFWGDSMPPLFKFFVFNLILITIKLLNKNFTINNDWKFIFLPHALLRVSSVAGVPWKLEFTWNLTATWKWSEILQLNPEDLKLLQNSNESYHNIMIT